VIEFNAMKSMKNGRRGHTFFVAIAQLALVAYLFQIAAFDHWQVDPSHDVTGVTGSQEHVIHDNHCHGSAGSCADGAGGSMAYVKFAEVVALPEPPTLVAVATTTESPTLTGNGFETLTPPPRAA
jgi:hypothetical protein